MKDGLDRCVMQLIVETIVRVMAAVLGLIRVNVTPNGPECIVTYRCAQTIAIKTVNVSMRIHACVHLAIRALIVTVICVTTFKTAQSMVHVSLQTRVNASLVGRVFCVISQLVNR